MGKDTAKRFIEDDKRDIMNLNLDIKFLVFNRASKKPFKYPTEAFTEVEWDHEISSSEIRKLQDQLKSLIPEPIHKHITLE